MCLCGPNNVKRAVQNNGSNIIALRFSDHGAKENLMLGVADAKI